MEKLFEYILILDPISVMGPILSLILSRAQRIRWQSTLDKDIKA